MKIVVLDGETLNPGDLSWQAISDLGKFSCFARTPDAEIIPRAQDAEIVFTNKTPLDAKTLAQLPKLKYVGVLATGTNVVDIAAAKDLGIVVTNVPAYGHDAVAQMVFAHILHHTQAVAAHHQAVAAGQWTSCSDFCFTLMPLQSLKGKTLGLIGYGDIGQQVAKLALAFGMKVLVNTRTEPAHLPQGVSWTSRDKVLKESDILSLHCPLTPETNELINAQTLELMKPQALLINTARGGLIDEAALAVALTQGRVFAGVDVLSTEPPSMDNPLLSAPNISTSPHNAWATKEARQNLLNIATENLKSFLQGNIRNCVNSK
ncbi:D-2-hydroxyacid dehydrogenase [Shewanella oneidensis MR-1]|uniref:NADH-dependent hydroxypyruvate reductase HprA n=1 Tax=Shewanella oneidensis (strain ATCC 700550 / JCM 31522 / CIP 106686 / LMG 19005 / NCIMB 14063 / MR-1) TaxID=211586 RepID=Q8EBA1_SHEON|nr:D-2-hydroxyacid dehydrogenase [Shewanella oneidensis]AAN56617.1 NADH-dependent hydroxypyruvate reductase HprA [Shewanella oneidensis MR-1]MDX5998992.1 D-2-hydroxyacid dehydrogenase [Shewanella oneidensis]MEE2027480.1 Hydroxypyruvate reductase [Shewanella oneidensis]QKG97979.1 D-2-hydroxyacid dehydrogenase [Shewanella oneidensis MR-1]